MLPADFVWLAALPLTPNGKIDREVLPKSIAIPPNEVADAPRNVLDKLLIRLWADALHRPTVGLHDNFFELGGHSLLAVRLASQLQETHRTSRSRLLDLRGSYGG